MHNVLLLIGLAAPLAAIAQVNLIPYGNLEYLADGATALPVWNRMGEPPSCDRWRASSDEPASGSVCITTDSSQEFILGAESSGGALTAAARVRADKEGTAVVLRISGYDGLNRKDQTQTFTVETKWQDLRLDATGVIAGPCELGIGLAPGQPESPRICVDDLALLAEKPPTNPMAEEAPFQAPPIDLLALQEYPGPGVSQAGTVPLTVDVPAQAGFGPISAGIPFPKGCLFSRDDVRVTCGGKAVACQADVLARWHGDGSIMVLLISLPDPVADSAQPLALEYGPGVGAARPDPPMAPPTVETTAGGYSVGAGWGGLRLSTAEPGIAELRVEGVTRGGLRPVIIGIDGQPLRQLGPSRIAIERTGPVSTSFVIRSRLGDAEGSPQFAADLRISFAQAYRIHQVSLYSHNAEAHGTEAVQLLDQRSGKVLGEARPAASAWYHFGGLDATTDQLLLRFTRKEGSGYITVSEIEVWGE